MLIRAKYKASNQLIPSPCNDLLAKIQKTTRFVPPPVATVKTHASCTTAEEEDEEVTGAVAGAGAGAYSQSGICVPAGAQTFTATKTS